MYRLVHESVEARWNKVLDIGSDLKSGPWCSFRRQAIAAVLENMTSRSQMLSEDITSGIQPNDNRQILGIVRKSLGDVGIFDIASVQPMTGPHGKVYVQSILTNNGRGSIGSGTDLTGSTFTRYYSSDYVSEEVIETGDASRTRFTGALAVLPIRPYNSTNGFSVTVTDGTETFTDNGSGTLTGDAGGSGTIDYTTGEFTVTFNAAPSNGASIVASYWQNMEGQSNVGELTPSYTAYNLEAVTRRLKYTISQETIDDMRAQMGIDPEVEVMNGMAALLSQEIERETVNLQVSNAQTTLSHSWSSTASETIDSTRQLFDKIGAISSAIARKTRTSGANYLVIPLEVANAIESLSTRQEYMGVFRREGSSVTSGAEPAAFGSDTRLRRWGTLNNKYTVYIDHSLSAGQSTKKVLIGYRGNGYFQAGTVYAPYIPATFSERFTDPRTNLVHRGLTHRGALKVIRPEFYGVLSVTGLPNL